MSESYQKFLSTLIVTIGAFLGFEALAYSIGLYQLRQSLYLSFYIYAFHIFWLTFIFDLHLKNRGVLAAVWIEGWDLKIIWKALLQRFDYMFNWHHFRHFQNYLVLPGLLYWSAVTLLFLNPFNFGLKQALVLFTTIAMGVTYWFMKEHISRRLEAIDWWIRILSIAKLFAAFLVYSALIGITFHFGYDATFLLLAVSTVTFLLIYQALFQHNLLNFSILLWIVIASLVMAIVSLWVYSNWNTQYFTAGVVMLAVYNSLWGILHHYLDGTLTRKIVFEYLVMMILVVSVLFASHNFNQRIV
ncbi:MAG: hypothetical protein A3J07_01540 [Candidatus Doudnabacteria bacterium RIFCSPLOWO2_02_FULL_49_13]|uniref:Uncharacterized protein n=1 Tax=Candidatus Doudnabacteria bacterium RIFCSPHIGHO2_12_FULL_48_16 TaxID=1817838 RepID=A0A1F5PL38_9BACT|nr:MAG: hypothetical protein A3B77_01175 [Candidatus Doudnabacteria bacterium RIFCSPHIGHO2_02_FULL_49_24]OGE90626.1 MAG: hypothetical protein A3E29_00635 [Candidatus Doudnabacteria bacterium RIFCSPHIGHO2_12_FULL_48_16]OGE96957.1 MAG: hypothetical protein A2990_02665 [Candidatus Doudnabacteria bacterium RIFCSPLOWO2_01_FULL_49_40]OGF02491.1 MAG: hypothetical protein A3J07_01540 [Candidatus Doudnabacteria bacterium RIFCSPLOWO2_02_FULL_49_13]